MPQLARGFVTDAELAEIVRQANALKLPGVIKINCTLDDDWSGDPAIFFWVTLSDAASRSRVLHGNTSRIREKLFDTFDPYNKLGLSPYFYFRSHAEQKRIREATYG